MGRRPPHEVLGVSPDATPEQIKSAYRRLARKYHTDAGGTDRAAWDELQEAYAVLSGEKPSQEAILEGLFGDAVRRIVPWSFLKIEDLGTQLKTRIGTGAASRLGRLVQRAGSSLVDAAVVAAQYEVAELVGGSKDGKEGTAGHRDKKGPGH